MSAHILTAGPIGWFGNIPCSPDTVCKRLPEHFVSPWKTWLQKGMEDAASRLGEAWPRRYLDMPAWKFFRNSPVADSLWVGMLYPALGLDGQPFPFTVAFEVPVAIMLDGGLIPIENRLKDIERLTLTMMQNKDLPSFEAAMDKLVLPSVDLNEGSSGDIHGNILSPSHLIDFLGKKALFERLTNQALFWYSDGSWNSPIRLMAEPLQAEMFLELVSLH